jgi:ParB-like chromosome segregation protein Spo0J
MSNITPALEQLKVPIAEVHGHPGNYRQGDVEGIAGSLARFGQLKPIVVQASTMNVVAGNHTLKAALSLGWEDIAAAVVAMPDDEAEAYLAADNRLSDKATNDDSALAPILERMMLAGRLEGTGYTPDDVDDMLASLDALPEVDAPTPEGTGGGTTNEELAERFKNRSQVALRQFVLMYDQDTATEVEGIFDKLKRAWGMTKTQDVALEALRRQAADPPVEGLTVEEAERANIVPEPEGAEATHAEPVDGEPTTAEGAAGNSGVAPVPPIPADELHDAAVHDAAPES